MRGEPLTPEARGDELQKTLIACEGDLSSGAIVSVDWSERLRVRRLPLV